MLALIAIVAVLASPSPRLEPACDESGYPVESLATCRASCSWWSKAEQRCRDADVESLGFWDPRPEPSEWPRYYTPPEPPAWGAYSLEKVSP